MVLTRKPEWLRVKISHDDFIDADATRGLIDHLNINTVCREASCPNYTDCFSRKTATFMILGVNCTRNCTFCNVRHGPPETVDPGEPSRVATAVSRLGLKYVVITSVTRDDLPDFGAGQFAAVISEIRRQSPGTAVEVLVPDFGGSLDALRIVANVAPDVISHNMETVRDLYDEVRPGADYERSLELIRRIHELTPDSFAANADARNWRKAQGGAANDASERDRNDAGGDVAHDADEKVRNDAGGDVAHDTDEKVRSDAGVDVAYDASERDRTDEGGDVAHDMGAAKKISIRSKSGFMLGLGETAAQVDTLMDDLRAVGCEFLTIGQYLAPSRTHHAVVEYVHPDVFDSYAKTARAKGFAFVASAPFVRSSYHAEEALAD